MRSRPPARLGPVHLWRLLGVALLSMLLAVGAMRPASADVETGTVEVRVVDADLTPLEGALVSVYGSEETVYEGFTGGTGVVTFDDVPEGAYDVFAQYEDAFGGSSVTVTAGTTATVQVLMPPPSGPGIEVWVHDELGEGLAGVDLALSAGGAEVDTAVTDEAGEALFEGLSTGEYTIVASKPGYPAVEAADTVIYEAGTDTYVDLTLALGPSCEPSSVNSGLTNTGFEDALAGWTVAHEAEGIAVTGADPFAEPWEGRSMARLGDSQPTHDGLQPPGPNVLCQDFVVTDPEETFAFNVFTYDYSGFDELHFDVVVTDPASGETLASYTQSAWGDGDDFALKTSGWRGITLDLADHIGETVRFAVRSGGTQDDQYAFWTYLDSSVDKVPPSPGDLVEDATSETGSVTTDPVTGQFTAAFPTSEPSPLTLTLQAACTDPDVPPSWVALMLDGTTYGATPTANGSFEVTIPLAGVVDGVVSLVVECAGETTLVVPIGRIVHYDPSGIVTDAATGEPVVGAEVRLYEVPGWVPREGSGPHPADSCETNESKGPGVAWSQPAPLGEGRLVSPASPEISPNTNPFVTNSIGHYGWDVAEGCWYVEVTAAGYLPLVSPVVGVPSAVTDLDLQLVADDPTPAVANVAAPTVSGTPKVGQELSTTGGTWDPADVTLAYQWSVGGVEVLGETESSYRPAVADIGRTVTVEVTASRVGYTSASVVSAATSAVVAADPVGPSPQCADASTGLATAKAALTQASAAAAAAQAAVTTAKAKLKKAKKSGNRAKIKKAKAKVEKAGATLATATSALASTGAAVTTAQATVDQLC